MAELHANKNVTLDVAQSDTGFESRCMQLRLTAARVNQGVARQQTPLQPQSFFKRLPYDVRRVIYDYIDTPPLTVTSESFGLYLSCWQGKQEMDHAAATRLRKCLIDARMKSQERGVVLQLPEELNFAPLPFDRVMDINITIPSVKTNPPVEQAVDTVDLLPQMKIGRLHIHFIDHMDRSAKHPHSFWERRNRATSPKIIQWLLSGVRGCPRPRCPSPPFRAREWVITWIIQVNGSATPARWLDGHKFEITSATSSRPYSYIFQAENAGAHVLVIPDAMEPAGMPILPELLALCRPQLALRNYLRQSRATMEFGTFEVRDGEPILPAHPEYEVAHLH
jgi:hypothetical protein